MLTNRHLYKTDTKLKVTSKRIIDLSSIKSVSLSKSPDSFAVVKVDLVSGACEYQHFVIIAN